MQYTTRMRGDITLPDDEVRFLEALPEPQMHARLAYLHTQGWSLASLARSLSTPRPKTTVHYWIRNAPTSIEQRRPAPKSPTNTIMHALPVLRGVKVRSIAPKVPPDMRPRLRELAQISRRYRAKTPPGSTTAQANKELTQLAVQLHKHGVPTSDIAAAAGLTYRAVARRIANAL
jgi:hypothetical protein